MSFQIKKKEEKRKEKETRRFKYQLRVTTIRMFYSKQSPLATRLRRDFQSPGCTYLELSVNRWATTISYSEGTLLTQNQKG